MHFKDTRTRKQQRQSYIKDVNEINNRNLFYFHGKAKKKGEFYIRENIFYYYFARTQLHDLFRLRVKNSFMLLLIL
jgi:hypothetical protein